MTVALDNLSGQCCGLETEFLADNSLNSRIEVRMRANGSANLANAHAFAHLGETLGRPRKLIEHQRQLQSESDRLSVNAVAAADHRGKLMLDGASCDDVTQVIQIVEQDGA